MITSFNHKPKKIVYFNAISKVRVCDKLSDYFENKEKVVAIFITSSWGCLV